MASDEIETVLANWIKQAISPAGILSHETDPAAWVAARFAGWWRERAEGALAEAEQSASEIQGHLSRLGG